MKCFAAVTVVMSILLLAATQFYMVKIWEAFLTALEMPEPSQVGERRRQGWCAVVVLVAVFSLVVSVATRYSSRADLPLTTVKACQAHASPEAKRQHLDKDADHWVAPVICLSLLQPRRSYPRIAPAGPAIAGPLFEESLFNRPPPSSESLS
jgi:hypothetical protein